MAEDISRKFCKRCHRELKDTQSKQIGYGPICYKKYLDRKKIYLFELPTPSEKNQFDKKEDHIVFTKDDIRKFYELYMRYDITSNNIGVVDRQKFNEICNLMKARYKDKPGIRILLNEDRTKLTVLEKEIDTTFILIRDSQDMRGRFFRKYI